MTLSQEALLTLLLLALYLHDAITFTNADTAFLVKRVSAGWVARFPSARFTLGGRHVFVPPLLPPATPVFTLQWSPGVAPEAAWDAERACASLALVSMTSALSFLVVLVLTPVVLLTRQGSVVVLATIGLAYATVVAGVACLWVSRRSMGLTRGSCARLTAEMLLCPPVAANLSRRLSQAMPVRENFIAAARRLLAEGEWEEAREALQARLAVQLEEAEPGSRAYSELENVRSQLA